MGCVITRLPLPGDRAVCHAWRSAARGLLRHQPPWIVLPDGSFCTTGHDGAFFRRIPGLPENATYLATTDGWLALYCTDDVFRRTIWDNFCFEMGTFVIIDARHDIKHRHTYLLHKPFSNVTVPLPDLDAVISHVAETFDIRKVLMRSSSTPSDDLIAITTNNWYYNVILCRPGKGTHVIPDFRVIDVAFLGDVLYAITSGEELLAFHLGEDKDGRPNVTRFKRVIENPMAGYYNEFSWSWPQDYDTK
ncbi:hypothetical protein BAE44_0000423 [Dichanthelium oligosanthes]|uniref:KIB1-4 beta-propeller domain-containing protein n=1 Tax=Dichanthelium oligosanthes TaxID=888268 RepID=A0A1E5WMF3_9POAL|nr:hypothetical protein BAE44_0000423 [Dichanthelium oligosanthes]